MRSDRIRQIDSSVLKRRCVFGDPHSAGSLTGAYVIQLPAPGFIIRLGIHEGLDQRLRGT